MTDKEWVQIKYFKKSEFDCKCGCGLNNMSKEFVGWLEFVRTVLDAPIIITSGSRCQTHNNSVGGSKTSPHLNGLAADIKVINSRMRSRIISSISASYIHRVGIGKNFIHVDMDESKTQNVMWVC